LQRNNSTKRLFAPEKIKNDLLWRGHPFPTDGGRIRTNIPYRSPKFLRRN
jgi:hypothetical protein